jgi:hypothetical protein
LPVRPAVGVEQLEAGGKRQLLEDFAEAPTSSFCESVNIPGDPVGAI